MKISVSMLALATALTFTVGAAHAQDKNVKIGVLTDMAGLYADVGGKGSVVAAQMAIDDSGLAAQGWKIDVVSADHQNKPDVGVNITRQWADQDKVDGVFDVLTSSVALAVGGVAKDKNLVYMNSGAAASDLTNAACSPNLVHWTYDTYLLANGTGKAVTKSGGDTWFFVTADYAFGAALERDTTAVVLANGGKVVGGVKHPLSNSDFSSFLLQAQASKAKIIGLANAGGDTTNSIKQAAEFGIVAGGQKLAALLLFLTDVHSLGLKVAQGLQFTTTFYWDQNDGTRGFAKKFAEKMANHQMPTMVQAGVYASVAHYLKALVAMGGNPHDGAKVVAKMKEMPTEDALFGKGMIQPNGRVIHPGYLWEVKKPEESKGEWDLFKLIATIPADEAFTPLDKSTCSLLKK